MPARRARRLLPILATLILAAAACDDAPVDPAPADTTGPADTNVALDTTVDVPEDFVPVEITDEDVILFHHSDFVTSNQAEEGTDLLPGGYLPVITGGQGLNMVLVGFRTRADLVEPLTVKMALEISGQVQSRTTYDFQQMGPEVEGWRSLYNLFLVLDGCRTFEEGTQGVFSIEITDAFGSRYERITEVVLGRNDLCFG